MTTISSISELLSLSGSQYRIYDVGRKINKISKEQFNKIELNYQPYPYPIQSHACLAIVFWQKDTKQPFIWFVKLPLDERGLLNQGARNHYIAIIIEALGKNITDSPSEQQDELLKNNPYHFAPAQYKMAAFNSIINVELKRSLSSHYEIFIDYLHGKLGWDNWKNIGVQGINDLAATVNSPALAQLLSSNINHIPNEVLTPLCIALENHTLPANVTNSILALINSDHVKQNEEVSLSLVRSLSSSTTNISAYEFMTKLIESDNTSVDTLVVLSGRFWELFTDSSLLHKFLENVARHNDNQLFAEIFKDLVSIPAIRPNVLSILRSTERSEALSQNIGFIFNHSNKVQ